MEVFAIMAVIALVLSSLSKAAKVKQNRPGTAPKPKPAPENSIAPQTGSLGPVAPLETEMSRLRPEHAPRKPSEDGEDAFQIVRSSGARGLGRAARAGRSGALNARDMRRAVITNEILGKPASMRNE